MARPSQQLRNLDPPFRSNHSVYHNKIEFTHGFISITLSTAIFITTGVDINNNQ